jgi:hypothetical protein
MSDGSLWSAQDFVTHYLSGTSGEPVNGREQRTPVTVDTDWFMSQGPGKNVSLASFTKVQSLYFGGAAQKADGVYSITDFLSASDRLGYLKNYTTNVDPNDPNYLAYSYVFGTSAFRLTDAKVFVQNGQITNITDPKITPLWDNFDFDTPGRDILDKFVINPLKTREANLVDPAEHGQQFDIRFTIATPASGSNTGGSPLWTQQQTDGTGNQPFVVGTSAVDFAAFFGHPFNGSAQDITSLLSGIGNGQLSFSGSYVPESDPNQYLTSSYSVQGGDKVFVSQQSTGWFASMVRNGEIDRTILNNNDGSRVDSQYDSNRLLQRQEDVFTNGTSAIKYIDTKNTHPYTKLEVDEDAAGKITAAKPEIDGQPSNGNNVDFSAVGQVLGSALGRALAPNNQFVQLAAGTVVGAVGQKLAQAFAASLTANGASVDLTNVFADFNVSIAGAGASSVASFLVAELGTALHLDGFGGQLFNAGAGGFAGSVASQIATEMARGASFEAAIGGIQWANAASSAAYSISSLLGSYLGHELVPAQTHEGAVGGQLLGAVGSAVGISIALSNVLGNILGGVLNFIVPGIGSLVGTVLGTIIGDHFGNTPHPAAIDLVDQAGYLYGSSHYQVSEGGSYNSPDQMAAATDAIINAYLTAVKGVALDHSKQTWVGYVTDPNFRYINGEVPTHKYLSFISPDDAVHAAALDVLQHLEVIGGDLLLKRAHHNSPSNIPDPGPEWNGLTAASSQSGAEKLVIMGADLSVAQDYENYLNNREAINALMAANPDSAFAAGWIATFARVNELGLNHVNASDFLGGLVGYLDSVNKAGLGAMAANATVKQSGGDVTVEIKVPNGTDVPGALSVFADQVSQSSGTTVQFGFINGLAAGFHGPGSTSLVSGVWQASGAAGNNLWFGRDDVRNEYHDYNGAQSHDILVGGAFSDTIYAGNGFDFVDGGAGGDYLFGQDGNDILRGGTDTDLLYGGAGDDTYVFNRGDGADTVFDDVTVTTTTSAWHDWYEDQDGINILHHDWVTTTTTDHPNAGTDSLVFGAGIARSDIAVVQSGNDLIVGVKDPAHPNVPFGQLTDRITLTHWFDDPNDRIENFVFADGTTLKLAGGAAALATYRVPFGAALSRSSVAENSANGTVVGTVTGFDLDAAALLSYSLSDYAGGRFAIDASSGVITVANGAALDYETTKSHQITVRTADQSGNASYTPFTIAVTNVSETSIVEGSGPTGMTLVENIYHLTTGGTGPSLKYLGADVTFGLTGVFAPVAAERTSTGYQVAWKNPGADQYLVWNTDAAGNFQNYLASGLSGSSLALVSLEPFFQQDLNSDGIIGIPFIEGFGSTGLAVADHIYYLLNGGSGPSLKYFGAAVGFGQTGASVPIAAERTATGYDVAWKNPGADQYTVWNTDADGNFLNYIVGVASGSSLAMEALEPTFHQDLNSDGIIGIPFIESFGSTGLAVADHIYYLLNGGSGPSLKYFGAAVGFGQTGASVPIAAERTATGYDVAWKNPGADQYTVWKTDGDGNFLNYIVGVASGSSLAMESLETTFQQDLNSDGIVGIPFIEGFGSTGLAVADHIYYLLSGGSGPTLKYLGATVGFGQTGASVPIAAERTATGYEVAWKNPNADQYTVWNTDADGNFLNYIVGVASGSSLELKILEPTFQQDLNGDGRIGPVTTMIETAGAIHFTRLDNNFGLFDNSGSGPVLKFFGADYDAGLLGGFVPVGAEQTPTGYEVAFKYTGSTGAYTGQYSIWNTDGNGNYLSYTLLAGNSLALESLEPSFQQDLNGDGIVGIPFIEGFGSTGLAVADHIYYLLSGGSGPSLKYFGAAVGFGQTGASVPIAAERTATGYDVAWKNPNADQYTVWSTDADGNFLNYIVGVASGSSLDLKILEPTFQQDLNGDGVIGTASAVIEGFGATSLTVADHIYHLTNGGSGPSLKYFGATVGFGETGASVPIAAEQTATGYDVAWKALGADQYTVWTTDAAGNFLSYITGVVSGSSLDLKILEPTFQQDLNGDGVIGAASAVIEGFGSTSLTVAGHIYYLLNGGSGPSLKYLGATVGFGETGTFAPIAAEQTATGYDVAWKAIGADQYLVWSTDAAGNYVSYLTGVVPGNSSDLKSLEGVFHQDLNGDGVIGGSPVILDLDGNGIDITPLNLSQASFDMDGGAGREHTAWAGANDGILAIDLGAGGKSGPDGVIDQAAEIVFTQWSPGATSDMAALRSLFDGNHNGLLDPGDARWSEFRIWQDANGDGVSQAGEVKTLDAWGIASIGLEPAGPATLFSDGSAIHGLASFTRTDGTTGAAGDVSLAYQHGAADTPAMMGPAFGDMIWRHVDAAAATLESEPINPHSLAILPHDWHIV